MTDVSRTRRRRHALALAAEGLTLLSQVIAAVMLVGWLLGPLSFTGWLCALGAAFAARTLQAAIAAPEHKESSVDMA